MEYLLPLKKRDGTIVGYSKVDKDDYDKFVTGFWHLSRGYASGKFGKLKGMLHRFILDAKKGDPIVDHINNDRLDNRKSNLRFATRSQNSQNKSKCKKTSSKYFGVSKCDKKWLCSLHGKNGKHITNRFDIEEHAAYWFDILSNIHRDPNSKKNGIEKPENFKEPIKKPIKKEKKHKGVYNTNSNKYNVVIFYDKKNHNLGTYDTEKEAIEIYETKRNEIDKLKKNSKVEIKRNKKGQAIIETFNKKGEITSECIVDDDKYEELIKFKWYNSLGYIRTHIFINKNTTISIHRYLMNAKKGDIVDHINNNPLDNRISNLRICTDSLNSHNRKIEPGSYVGVSYNGYNYSSQITKDGDNYILGTYITKMDAAKAYDIKARELYGLNANTNFEEIYDTKDLVTSYQDYKKNTTSKYKGVSLTKSNTFQLHVKGKYFGAYKTEEEAAKLYDDKIIELFGIETNEILNFSS
jgi:hypothetical protein